MQKVFHLHNFRTNTGDVCKLFPEASLELRELLDSFCQLAHSRGYKPQVHIDFNNISKIYTICRSIQVREVGSPQESKQARHLVFKSPKEPIYSSIGIYDQLSIKGPYGNLIDWVSFQNVSNGQCQ